MTPTSKPLNSNMIKLIAIAAMTIDHIAWLVFPGYPRAGLPVLMHIIGRITCPVMCYCVAEGYHYTKDIGRYTRRLCILAFGTNRGNFRVQMLWMIFYVAIYSTVYFFAIDRVYGVLQMAVILSIPVILMYNGQRGSNRKINNILKWLFYIYYPLHLFIIGCIQFFVLGGQ